MTASGAAMHASYTRAGIWPRSAPRSAGKGSLRPLYRGTRVVTSTGMSTVSRKARRLASRLGGHDAGMQ
eukprot:3313532-Prymnesium_polylepis.3